MSSVGRGDFVEALSDDKSGYSTIKKGNVLQVRETFGPNPEFGLCKSCNKDLGRLLFYGIVTPIIDGEEGGWCPCGSKPTDPPGKDVIADLMKLPAMQPRRRVCEPA